MHSDNLNLLNRNNFIMDSSLTTPTDVETPDKDLLIHGNSTNSNSNN